MLARIVYGILALGVFVPVAFFILGYLSKSRVPKNFGLNESGTLQVCSKKSNCVSSAQGEEEGSFIQPLFVAGLSMPELADVAAEMGIVKVKLTENYFHGTAESKLFKFVDDVELHLVGETLHMKSASRVGRKDFNANRLRLERLKQRIQSYVEKN